MPCKTAAELIALFRRHDGQTRAAWEEALEAYAGDRVDYDFIRGLAKVLERPGRVRRRMNTRTTRQPSARRCSRRDRSSTAPPSSSRRPAPTSWRRPPKTSA